MYLSKKYISKEQPARSVCKCQCKITKKWKPYNFVSRKILFGTPCYSFFLSGKVQPRVKCKLRDFLWGPCPFSKLESHLTTMVKPRNTTCRTILFRWPTIWPNPVPIKSYHQRTVKYWGLEVHSSRLSGKAKISTTVQKTVFLFCQGYYYPIFTGAKKNWIWHFVHVYGQN